MLAVISGVVAGTLHVFSGPDHLAAVAPLSVHNPQNARRAGFRWGAGHACGVAAVGIAALIFRAALPVEQFSAFAERFVGVALGLIGLFGIRAALRNHVHSHQHSHDGSTHEHIHVHSHTHAPAETPKHMHAHTAFAVGILHGFAGSSHFIGVLPALAFPTMGGAIAYILAYGVGTVIAMTSFATVMGATARRFSLNGATAYRRLMLGCSTAAIAVGAYWLVA